MVKSDTRRVSEDADLEPGAAGWEVTMTETVRFHFDPI
jgi:hypothetical protein